jgi:hypothetical protein
MAGGFEREGRRASRGTGWLACACLLLSWLPAAPGRASDRASNFVLYGELGAGGGGSSWAADAFGLGSALLGARLYDWITVHGELREAFARIDERLLTTLAFGFGLAPPLTDEWRLSLDISGIHQHEEAVAYAKINPIGVPFGIGTGIRHRAGGELSLGVRYELLSLGNTKIVTGMRAFGSWLPNDRGPELYVGLLGLLGLELEL